MAERFETLVDLFEKSCRKYAERPLYGTKRAGAWEWVTFADVHALVDRFRGGLASLGVKAGDRVAIIADNRVEWVVAAYATYGLDAAFVPMYEAQLPREWKYILRDCGAKVVIAGKMRVFDELTAMRGELPAVEHLVGLDLPGDDPRSFAGVLAAGDARPEPIHSPTRATIAGMIYTSGTTGNPKGVLLSHDNVTSNINGVHSIFTFEPDDRSLAFLPWAHAYGQTCEVHGLLSMGCSTAINDDLAHLVANLGEVKPTILLSVPRIFHRMYNAVAKQIAERPAILQRIIKTGLASATKLAHGERIGPLERLELAFDERAVFSKIRERFGGRLKYAISASAPLNHDVAEFIDAIGMSVYEGYGLTETSPIVAVNFPGMRKLGSVGRVIPGVRVVIDRSVGDGGLGGEIVVYGPNVMVGYHQLPDENAKAFTPDGGFRTGDLGYLDDDGYLYVTGRIKEQYKLENGKYVMPAPLEDAIKLSPFIANAMVHGDGKPFNVMIVVVDEEAVRRWAKDAGHTLREPIAEDERVKALLRSEVSAHARDFKPFERPHALVLTTEDFTPQNGLLTPTLKLKRRAVLEQYRERIEAAYRREAESMISVA